MTDKMNFSAAIFDLDGTLLDSMGMWDDIDEEFFAEHGLTIPDDYSAEIKGKCFRETAEYTINRFGLSYKPEELVALWEEMVYREYAHNIRLKPNAREYLTALRHSGIKTAVATSLSRRLYKAVLENNDIISMFDILCSSDDVGGGKETPEIFHLAAERLGEKPQKCIVFEDVLPAVKSAKQAGMTVIGVYDKSSAECGESIKEAADDYIYNFSEAPLFEA